MVENFDTIIVPAHAWGFENVLLESNIWYLRRIDEKKINKIKYIAFYQTTPISSITCYSKIKSIKYSWVQSCYVVYLDGKLNKIKNIILDRNNKYLAPQSIKYFRLKDLLKSRKLSDIYNKH